MKIRIDDTKSGVEIIPIPTVAAIAIEASARMKEVIRDMP